MAFSPLHRMSRRAQMLAFVGVFGLAPAVTQATVFTNVPEAATYRLAYELDIPDFISQGWATNPAALLAAYSVNNSASIATGSFSRVGYYLELGGNPNPALNGFVYASFDADGFAVEASKLGVPNQVSFQQKVTNMNVVSNYAGIVNGTGLATGNVEFWPSNYSQGNAAAIPGANGGTYDFGDTISTAAPIGHGSMQIHNHGAGQTLMAYNSWGSNNRESEIGIGNQPAGQPDWTFNGTNNDGYTIQKLQIVVDNTPTVAAAPPAPPAVVALSPSLAGYQLVYQEALAGSGGLHGGVAYDVDNSALIQDGSFNRVAYVLELAGGDVNGFVAVSFDAAGFATRADKLGIPVDAADIFYQQFVDNLSVESNVAGVVNGDFAQGNVEFWPTNYGPQNSLPVPGASGTGNPGFDFGDGGAGANGSGFGSMQIHNFLEGQTLLAYNNFGSGGAHNLGIGNNPFAVSANQGLDWTFRGNATGYTVKNLYILVQPNAVTIPEPATLGLLALGGVALIGRRRRTV